ncbi:MAG: DUF3780 domain-containing protein [Desulfobacula sp.]|jgi:hypothetical protein|nr:DUF3780 domain-containing protein [Desulfobacula sp.]
MPQKKKTNWDFGFNPDLTDHYFLVSIPTSRSKTAHITVSEHFELQKTVKGDDIYTSLSNENAQIKVLLERFRWDEIADETRAEFNRRLRTQGMKTCKWKKKGQIFLERTLGKELVLLAWAIENCDPALISTGIRNWLGLVPEERWWLYTMTNASTGHATNDVNKGWRKAIRFALTENPISDQALLKKRQAFQLSLFGENFK